MYIIIYFIIYIPVIYYINICNLFQSTILLNTISGINRIDASFLIPNIQVNKQEHKDISKRQIFDFISKFLSGLKILRSYPKII